MVPVTLKVTGTQLMKVRETPIRPAEQPLDMVELLVAKPHPQNLFKFFYRSIAFPFASEQNFSNFLAVKININYYQFSENVDEVVGVTPLEGACLFNAACLCCVRKDPWVTNLSLLCN